VPAEAKGKDDTSMTTCQESNRRFVQISRHRYPIVPRGVPEEDTPTGAGGELMGVMAEVFG
jgi:hypothetical protein